jgi:hypothetical protein
MVFSKQTLRSPVKVGNALHMDKEILNTKAQKALQYVCSLGVLHEKLCEKLTGYLEDVSRKGNPVSGLETPPYRKDRGIHYKPSKH